MDETNRYYKILGVKPGASPTEIKQAYRGLVKIWHPDRFSHDGGLQQKAQERLKEITTAYEKIRHPAAGPPLPVSPSARREPAGAAAPSSNRNDPGKYRAAGKPAKTLPTSWSLKNLWPLLALGILSLALGQLLRQPAKKENPPVPAAAPKAAKAIPRQYQATVSYSIPSAPITPEPDKNNPPANSRPPQTGKSPIADPVSGRLERNDWRWGEATISRAPRPPHLGPPGGPRHRPPPPHRHPPGGPRPMQIKEIRR